MVNQVVQEQLHGDLVWVRDITLSNTMWGNRSLTLQHPRAGVHALGGGIGQSLAMGIGSTVATTVYPQNMPKTHINNAQAAIIIIVLCGDGGFMRNLGELACAVQERANMLIVLMNDGGYGVIKNIQNADYGSRHCYVDLHTPVVLEVDMKAWGPFAKKFAGPVRKH